MHARKIFSTARTAIKESARPFLHGKGQRMTPRFIADTEIAAGLAPFGSVRRNTAVAGAELREEMRQLMPQRAIDLDRVVVAQTRIQRDELTMEVRATGGAEKPGVPFHVDGAGKFRGVELLQHLARFRFELKIAAEHDEQRPARQTEIELFKQRHRRGSSLSRGGDS